MSQDFDPLAFGVGLATAGLNFFGERAKSQQALAQRNRQIRFQNRQARENVRLQNLMIADRNRYAQQEYESRVNQYNRQREFNQEAANLAYVGEQQRLNELFKQSAFQRSGLQRQMLEAAGANAAMAEGRGRSFERAAALGTSGQFGRAMEQLRERTADQRRASGSRMQQISLQQYGRDLAGYANVAMTPYMQRQLPPPLQMPQQRSSGFNTALQIGQSLLGGTQVYRGLAAPPAGDTYITNRYNYSGPAPGPGFDVGPGALPALP